MQSQFAGTDDMAAALRALLPMNEESKRKLDKKFRLEFNYNSNHLEGNTLTYGETELLIIFDRVNQDHDVREIEEMKAHDAAMKMIQELAEDKERGLTETFIRQLNKLILVRPFWKEATTIDGQRTRRLIEPGAYKKFENSVRLANGEIFNYAGPDEIPALMQDLMEFYRTNTDKHPVWQAAMMHYKLVRIHPFDDGNGRVARLLMNYILYKYELPPVVIKSTGKKEYLWALNLADIGDTDAFVRYIMKQLEWSLSVALKAARGEDIEEGSDVDKEIELRRRNINQGKVNKSPKIVYRTFQHIESFWQGPLFLSLSSFIDFFNESDSDFAVEKYQRKDETGKFKLMENSLTRATGRANINGFDLYEYDIDVLCWRKTFYGLKGADAAINLRIQMNALFQDTSYRITVAADHKTCFEIEKAYSAPSLGAEVNDLKVRTKKAVLTFVDEQLKAKP